MSVDLDGEPSRKTLLEIDLVNAAIHEAGHLMIARHFGRVADIRFYSHADDDDLWQTTSVPAQLHYLPAFKKGGHELRLLGAAGVVAEYLASEDDPYFDSEEFCNLIEAGMTHVSPTDLAAVGDLEPDLFDECADILRERWPELITAAKEAITEFRHVSRELGDKEGAVGASAALKRLARLKLAVD